MNSWKIGCVVVVIILTVLCLVFIGLYIYAYTKRYDGVIIPTIQYDQKGFSSNELSIINRKSVPNACGIDTAQIGEMGRIVVITPESLRLPLPSDATKGKVRNQARQVTGHQKTTMKMFGAHSLKIITVDEYLDFTNMGGCPVDATPLPNDIPALVVPSSSQHQQHPTPSATSNSSAT